MSWDIHCRRTSKGLRFRVFSTVTMGYLTPALTRDRLRLWLCKDTHYSGKADLMERIKYTEPNIELAAMHGTDEMRPNPPYESQLDWSWMPDFYDRQAAVG